MPSKKTMDKLAAAAARLNRASDELNDVLEVFEAQLAAAGVGVVYWLGADRLDVDEYLLVATDLEAMELDSRTEVDSVRGWLLGYDKIDGKWHVAVKNVVLIEERDEYETGFKVYRSQPPIMLMKAPRMVRVEAAGQLERLANALTEKLESYASDVEAAQDLLLDNEVDILLAQCRRLASRLGLNVEHGGGDGVWGAEASDPGRFGFGPDAAGESRPSSAVIEVADNTQIGALQKLKTELTRKLNA